MDQSRSSVQTGLMRRIVTGALVASAFASVLFAASAGQAAAAAGDHAVGDQCFGYQIGMIDLDAAGNSIICDSDYTWHVYVGQGPTDPWVAGQNAG